MSGSSTTALVAFQRIVWWLLFASFVRLVVLNLWGIVPSTLSYRVSLGAIVLAVLVQVPLIARDLRQRGHRGIALAAYGLIAMILAIVLWKFAQ